MFPNTRLCSFFDQNIKFSMTNQCAKYIKFALTGQHLHRERSLSIAHLSRNLSKARAPVPGGFDQDNNWEVAILSDSSWANYANTSIGLFAPIGACGPGSIGARVGWAAWSPGSQGRSAPLPFQFISILTWQRLIYSTAKFILIQRRRETKEDLQPSSSFTPNFMITVGGKNPTNTRSDCSL